MYLIPLIYVVIGGIVYFLVAMTDEYNPQKWIPTFVLTVFLWPLIFMAWGMAAMIK